jgi:hypothetical protein
MPLFMSCADTQRELHEARPIGMVTTVAAREHLAGCRACQQVQQELFLLGGALRSQPAPDLPPGFALSLRRRLAEEPALSAETPRSRSAPRSRRRWIYASCAAAAVLLLALGSVLLYQTRTGSSVGDRAALGYHRLHLSVSARQSHPEALFDVTLPEGVRLDPAAGAALGEGQVLRWRSALRPGLNEVDLPLVARQLPARVEARITVSGKSVSRAVVIAGPAPRAAAAESPLQLALALDEDPQPREVVR